MARTPRSTKALPVRNGEAQLCNLLWEVWAVLYLPGEDGVLGTRVVPSPPPRRCGRINVAGGLLSQGADPARALNTELFFFFKACVFWRVMDITPFARYTLMLICIQVCGIVR